MNNNTENKELKGYYDKKETYRSFINALPFSAAILNKKGVILCVNEHWKEFGQKNNLSMKNHGIGFNYIKISEKAEGKDADLAFKAAGGIRKVIAGKKDIFTMEYPCHFDDQKRWFKMKVKSFKEGALLLHENITERKLSKIRFEELAREYETIFDNVETCIYLIDIDEKGEFRYQRFNPREEEKLGLKTKEVKGKTPVEVFGPDTGETIKNNYKKCVQNKKTISYREKTETSEGEEKIWSTKVTPIIIKGKVEKIIGNSSDITELEEEKAKQKAIFNNPFEMIYLHDVEGNIMEVNDAVIENMEYTEEKIRDLSIFDLHGSQTGKYETAEIIKQWEDWDVGERVVLERKHKKKD